MASLRFKHWFSEQNYKREVNNEPSLTIPDDSLSIVQIIDRFVKGLPTDNVHRYPATYQDNNFNDDDFSVDPANQFGLDLTDIDEMRNAASDVIDRYKRSQQTPQNANATTTNDDANANKGEADA